MTTETSTLQTQSYKATWWDPTSFADAEAIAERMSKSSLVPKNFMGKPDDILVAWSLGAQVGLSLLYSIQNIAVINGRPSIWGDAALALVKPSSVYEDIEEFFEGEGESACAVCVVKRRGEAKPTRREFSVKDAARAGLWNNEKKEPWSKYPKRMLQMRARSWALRDTFPDVLGGLSIREEMQDAEVTVLESEPVSESGTATQKLKAKLQPKPDQREILQQLTAGMDEHDVLTRISKVVGRLVKDPFDLTEEDLPKVVAEFQGR